MRTILNTKKEKKNLVLKTVVNVAKQLPNKRYLKTDEKKNQKIDPPSKM